MITQAPDKSLDAYRLDYEIEACISNLQKQKDWFLREKYVDRGCIYDPFYIIDIRDEVEDQGDTTWDEPLYYINSYCSMKQVTNESASKGYPYWQKIDKYKLEKRLTRFLKLYSENCLQAPGYKVDHSGNKKEHEKFYKKRFLYELRQPSKSIVGVGPSIYAGGFASGALCGQVTDKTGAPLAGVMVELVSKEQRLNRETINGGLFWFSRVPEGKYSIRVIDRSCEIHILKTEEFGNIKGWVTDQNVYPVERTELKFLAPDGEVFKTRSDTSGKFETGILPAFPVSDTLLSKYPYIMQIPDFMFSVTKSVVVKDAIIGGILRGNDAVSIANETVLLKQGGIQVAETKTDGHGNFRFFELEGGKYELEVPGQKIYLSQSSPGRVEGKEPAGIVNETRIELVVEGKVVATERLSMDKEFSFEDVAPGRYNVRTTTGGNS